jgi:hypothetical protein
MPLGRPRRRWEYNIEMAYESVNWIQVDESKSSDRLLWKVNVPLESINGGKFLDQLSDN